MSLPDVASLKTLLDDNKVGEDCEYDNLYLQLEELASPVAEQEIGDAVTEGRDADFKTLVANCTELWKKTRDLRVAAYLTVGYGCTEGFSGLKLGLSLIDFLVDELWEECYPRLDPEDDNDPTERINILNMLSPQSGSYNDPVQFINHLRKLKFLGNLPYTVKDVLVSQGMLESNEEGVDLAILQGQLRSTPSELFAEKIGQLDEIQELLNHIVETMNAKMGDGGMVSFESLSTELKHIRKLYSVYAGGTAQESGAEEAEEQPAETEALAAAPAPTVGSAGMVNLKAFRVQNRNDALLLIERCAEYFRKAEPTSPLPYLLDRALRMADMNFVDILAEIDESSLEKVKEQLGVKTPSS